MSSKLHLEIHVQVSTILVSSTVDNSFWEIRSFIFQSCQHWRKSFGDCGEFLSGIHYVSFAGR